MFFINFLDVLVGMESFKIWDGAKKMVHHIGWLPIPGTMTGAIMVLSRSFVVPTTVELREALLPDCPDTTEYLFKCIYILLIKTVQKPLMRSVLGFGIY